MKALIGRMEKFKRREPKAIEKIRALDQRDVIVIAYGDHLQTPNTRPLRVLTDFISARLADTVSGVHILPFFPYSSDDGFSIVDYRQVRDEIGGWQDVTRLSRRYRLMVDLVLNHVSSQSDWFQAFLRGEEPYSDYFIIVDPRADLSRVVRPRSLPLLTRFETKLGPRHVWTTFSADQIDLNYANPRVLLEMIDILLFYVSHGAQLIRLDAIAYLWKEIGTSCIHLPQTHAVVKLFRAILDAVAPGVVLITETNVPHRENISYFGEPISGDGTDEAQLVYQFPLAPLILHTFITGDARKLSAWADGLTLPAREATFLNFIASHDGIGVRPVEGLLTPDEIQALVARTRAHDGLVSYKTNADGSQSVYELNTTLFDALTPPDSPDPEMDARRYLASQAIMLALAGVPGIYLSSLFGGRNCLQCVEESGTARSINREKYSLETLSSEILAPDSLKGWIFQGYRRLLENRRAHSAFHPTGDQRVLSVSPAVFAILRTSPDKTEYILALTNVTPSPQTIEVDVFSFVPGDWNWRDLLGDQVWREPDQVLQVEMGPFQSCWLATSNA